MHVLVGLLIVGVVLYLLFKDSKPAGATSDPSSETTSPGAVPDGFSGRRLVFISRGKLFLKEGAADLQELHSPYVQGVVDRMERSRQLHAWKKDTAFESSYISNRPNIPSEQHTLRATSAQFTPQGKLLYFLRDDHVGGLFEYDFDTGDEKRLIHRQQLLLDDLSLDRAGQRLVCSQHNANGAANITLMDADGANYREVTGGDTVDSAPAWVHDDSAKIVFQSSGIARNEHGYMVALGPSAIHMLDLNQGELTSVVERGDTDYLQPKVAPSGDLLFIRRPYEPPRYGSNNFLVDFFLFPFRLLRAIFHYLNFFSLMYSRKPLTSASGPQVQADLKELLIKGKRIDAENALRKEERVNGIRSLVPKSWQLVKRNRQGEEQVLATNVAAYDILNDGTVIFTNGYGVFVLDPGKGMQVVMQGKLIAELVAC